MGVKERLVEFLKEKDISQGKFEKDVGLSNGFVNNIGDSIRSKSMNKIVDKYPELNTSWLLTGEGPMIKTQTIKVEETLNYLLKISFKQQGQINTILKTLEVLAAKASKRKVTDIEKEMLKAAGDEAERLRKEYLDTHKAV